MRAVKPVPLRVVDHLARRGQVERLVSVVAPTRRQVELREFRVPAVPQARGRPQLAG